MAIDESLEVTHRICSFCEATCGLELTIDRAARKLISVKGHKEDVLSQGYLCPKAVALKDLDEDPDRLRVPLVRRGGNLEEATWEEAFAEVKKRLLPIMEDHGRHAVAMYTGNPTAHKPSLSLALGAVSRAVGTPNMFSASTLDQMPRHVAAGLMYGSWTSVPVPDIDRTDLLVIVGGNPLVSNGSMWTVPNFRGRLAELKKRGGSMVVVDPKRTQTAKAADQHLAIRPGTDAFFFASILNTMFKEDLVNAGRSSDLITDEETLREAVWDYTPEETASVTGMAPEDVRGLARKLCKTERAALYARIGTSVAEFGGLANWFVEAINILAGNLDREGGLLFAKAPAFNFNVQRNPLGESGEGKGVRWGRRHSRVRGAPELMGEFSAVCLAEEIETPGKGQVRALITTAGNPVLSAPNGERLARALDKLDFMVSIDIYLNETTSHADVIFPGGSPLEDIHFPVPFQAMSVRNTARYSPVIFEVEEGRPPEWQIMYQLGLILSGQDEAMSVEEFDDFMALNTISSALRNNTELEGLTEEDIMGALGKRRGPERAIDVAVRTGPYGDMFGANPDGISLDWLEAHPEGADLGPLEPRLPSVLRTPGGKINLMPEAIKDDFPRLKEGLGRMKEEAAGGDRLLLIGRRNTRTNNSWMHNLPTLAKGRFKGALEMSPADASARGLSTGDMAHIKNKSGALTVPVDVTDDMSEGTVSLPHGFGHAIPGTNLNVAAQNPGVNSNQLANENALDPMTGTAILNGIWVEVSGV